MMTCSTSPGRSRRADRVADGVAAEGGATREESAPPSRPKGVRASRGPRYGLHTLITSLRSPGIPEVSVCTRSSYPGRSSRTRTGSSSGRFEIVRIPRRVDRAQYGAASRACGRPERRGPRAHDSQTRSSRRADRGRRDAHDPADPFAHDGSRRGPAALEQNVAARARCEHAERSRSRDEQRQQRIDPGRPWRVRAPPTITPIAPSARPRRAGSTRAGSGRGAGPRAAPNATATFHREPDSATIASANRRQLGMDQPLHRFDRDQDRDGGEQRTVRARRDLVAREAVVCPIRRRPFGRYRGGQRDPQPTPSIVTWTRPTSARASRHGRRRPARARDANRSRRAQSSAAS